MVVRASAEAGVYLAEHGKLKEGVEEMVVRGLQERITSGELTESEAEQMLPVLLLNARLFAQQLWETFGTVESPPVPTTY